MTALKLKNPNRHPVTLNAVMSKKIIIGRFGAPFGVKGWIKVNSFTRPNTNIELYSNWCIKENGAWKRIAIDKLTLQHTGYIAKIHHCDNRDAAAILTNHDIAIDPSELPNLSQDEYYWSDLMGLKVLTLEQYPLGNITDMLETSSNDVMVVTGDKRRLIPYTDSVVKEVNLSQGIITVDWDPDF